MKMIRFSSIILVFLISAVSTPYDTNAQFYSCEATAGTLSEENPALELVDPLSDIPSNFCTSSVPSPCYGTEIGTIPFTIRIPDGHQEVDLLCEVTVGRICVMDDSCQTEMGQRESDSKIVLKGPVQGNLKIVMLDKVDNDAAICNSLTDSSVLRCTGPTFDSDLIHGSSFEDHEGGQFSDWSRLHCPGCTNTAGLRRSLRSSKKGTYGLEANYKWSTRMRRPAYLVDSSPDDELRYVIKFAIKPIGSFKMAARDKHDILRVRQQNPVENVLITRLQSASNGNFKLVILVRVRLENGSGFRFKNIGSVTIKPRLWTRIDIDWKAATGEGANDGFVRLYKNKRLWKAAENLDIHGLDVDQLLFGQVGGVDSGTRGTIFYDNFDSRRKPRGVEEPKESAWP